MKWPSGTYGLPQPQVGCPDDTDLKWKTGWTYHDTEDDSPANQRSGISHMAGNFTQHGIQQNFCIKDSAAGGSEFWPDGKYCLYKKGKTITCWIVKKAVPDFIIFKFTKWVIQNTRHTFMVKFQLNITLISFVGCPSPNSVWNITSCFRCPNGFWITCWKIYKYILPSVLDQSEYPIGTPEWNGTIFLHRPSQ